MGITEAKAEIARLDRLIDTNRAAANDKVLENDLFRQRGFAQRRRDEAIEADAMKTASAMRFKRARKCPTCGHRTLAA